MQTMLSLSPVQRRIRRKRSKHWLTVLVTIALELNHLNALAYNSNGRAMSRFSQALSPFYRTSTAVCLWGGFDGFLHPYGVSDRANNDREDDDGGFRSSSVELLDALLPRLRTNEDQARILEGFQRARLHEQLRLSRRARSGASGAGTAREAGDGDPEEGTEGERLAADAFQRARLAEQLRLQRRHRAEVCASSPVAKVDPREGPEGRTILLEPHSKPSLVVNKGELFQRALLEERLKTRASSLVNDTRVEHEKDLHKDHEPPLVINENDKSYGLGAASTSTANAEAIVAKGTHASNGNGYAEHLGSKRLSVPQTMGDGDDLAQQLGQKLQKLRDRVVAAKAASASASSAAPSRTIANANSSLQSLLSTTHLPLPPREDAPLPALALAPAAHVLSCGFLLGAAGFYAVLAVADVLRHDGGRHGAQTCLREAVSLWVSCFGYAFSAASQGTLGITVRRIIKAMQTSAMAAVYIVQGVCVRAPLSKYAKDCVDAGAGALRYLVYTARATNFLWARSVDTLIGSLEKNRRRDRRGDRGDKSQSWTHQLNPLQFMNRQRSLWAKRRHYNERYKKKLHLLEANQLKLERGQQELDEMRGQVDFERQQLQIEAVNLVAWYYAAREATSAAEAAVKAAKAAEEQNRRVKSQTYQEKKRRWRLWQRG